MLASILNMLEIGQISSCGMHGSYDGSSFTPGDYWDKVGLFPIVSLSSELIEKSDSSGFIVK